MLPNPILLADDLSALTDVTAHPCRLALKPNMTTQSEHLLSLIRESLLLHLLRYLTELGRRQKRKFSSHRVIRFTNAQVIKYEYFSHQREHLKVGPGHSSTSSPWQKFRRRRDVLAKSGYFSNIISEIFHRCVRMFHVDAARFPFTEAILMRILLFVSEGICGDHMDSSPQVPSVQYNLLLAITDIGPISVIVYTVLRSPCEYSITKHHRKLSPYVDEHYFQLRNALVTVGCGCGDRASAY
ncbi:hypothetical protein J6590_017284 [Homalodisca vitripennis]|nr:hypothetical protein J6590_017284 [Homalodisca vitripennis]